MLALNRDTAKRVEKVVSGIATSDGAGVSLTRIIGQPDLPRLDPFLMLDFFGSNNPGEYIAGFPAHPHRGFQTVTYMLAGKMRHKDSVGNEGVIEAGGIQWMNAGKGIIHEEMPEQEEGLLQGFQLWVNLPASEKMSSPNYQDIKPNEVPEVSLPNATVKVLAGSVQGTCGPVKTAAVSPSFYDVTLKQGDTEIQLEEGSSGFVYVYEGQCNTAVNNDANGSRSDSNTTLKSGELGVLSNEGCSIVLSTDTQCKCIVVAGQPINEPVVQYGPFVMNTQQEIIKAFNDYQSGTLA